MSVLHTQDSTIDTLEHLHEKAESQIIQNDFGAAIRTYSDILLMEPDDETAYTGLGNCYLVLGQFKKANEAFHNALSINPQNAAAIIGIQKIMDPDGVEGMVHPAQMEAEEQEPSLEPKAGPVPIAAPRSEPALVPLPAAFAHPQAPAGPAALPGFRPVSPLPGRSAPVFSDFPPHTAVPLPRRSAEIRMLPAPSARPAAYAAPNAAIGTRPEPAWAPLPRLDPEKAEIPIRVVARLERAVAPILFEPISLQSVVPEAARKPVSFKPVPPKTADIVDARDIQKALRNTGFYSGPIDGILGPGSRKAIEDFQRLHGTVTDGVVGPKTWATLRLYLDPE